MSDTLTRSTPRLGDRRARTREGGVIVDSTTGKMRRAGSLDDGKYALQATESDGTTKSSSALKPVISPLPVAVPSSGTFFSYASGGPLAGSMWLSWGWSASTLYYPDGTTGPIPAAPAAPAAPTLSQVAGGSFGSRVYYVRITYVRDGIIYPVSAESSLTVNAGQLLKVTSPTNPGSYDSWAVLAGTASNGEHVQGTTFPFGTDFTESPISAIDTSNNTTPWSTSWKSLTAEGLLDSTNYYFYPFHDTVWGNVRIPYGSAQSATLAQTQNGDGHAPLSSMVATLGVNAMKALTAAAGFTGSGNGGGGALQ